MLCGDVNPRELSQSVLTLTEHDTLRSYSMASVGTISDLYDSQTRIKIKAFDPTKPEEYEIWEASFLSTLSARAKASINLGRPTREMAASFVGANRSDYESGSKGREAGEHLKVKKEKIRTNDISF